MENPVRAGSQWIMGAARWVRMDPAGIAALATELRDVPPVGWEGRYHFRGEEELTLRYLLALDALNFCFWPPSPITGEKWSVPGPGGGRLTGYFALAYALRQAAEHDPPFFAPAALQRISSDWVRDVLGGIPLLPWRVRALQEVGEALLRFGSAQEFFARASGSCRRLVELVTAHLPLFRDAALYRGREVFFHKRAQILCADLAGTFGGEGPGALRDLGWLTAFADYKLPQLLAAHGALVLHPALAGRIRRQIPLAAGSAEEVELRAATVVAVEELTSTLRAGGRSVLPFEVDWMLWNLSQERLPIPHPRVLTPFY
ncbi:MAG: queuosine salvage family protein [Candidatus Bipolaricaulis anaerobius]|nr:queuosine salvage family protein [Candidatus Bipolaricaulis anaerobius]